MVPDTSLMTVRDRLEDVSEQTMLIYEGICLVLFWTMLAITTIQIANRLVPIDHPWELRWTVAWSVRMMLFTSFLGVGLVHYHREDIEINSFKEWFIGRSSHAVGTLYQLILNLALLAILTVLAYATTTFGLDTLDVNASPIFFDWFKQGHLVLALAVGLIVAFLARLVWTLSEIYRLLRPHLGPPLAALWGAIWR